MYVVTLRDSIDVPIAGEVPSSIPEHRNNSRTPTLSFPFDSDGGEPYVPVRTFTADTATINSAGEYAFEYVEYGFDSNLSTEQLVVPKENVAGLQEA